MPGKQGMPVPFQSQARANPEAASFLIHQQVMQAKQSIDLRDHALTSSLLAAVLTTFTFSAFSTQGEEAGDRFDTPGAFNPIVPGYFADPTIKKFGDTYYLYATTDGNGGGRGPSQAWISKDFVSWTLVPMNWPSTPFYWAPDVFKKDEKYYLYYSQPCEVYGAVSDSPLGPWSPLGGGNGLVIPNFLCEKVITLDGQIYEDHDGSLYMYWGTWGIYPDHGCGVGIMKEDMKSMTNIRKIPNTQLKDFFEAPYMLEKDGVYFLTYSSGSCHDHTYRVQYAVGDSPDGEFVMGPNNPILTTTADKTIHGPGHHSYIEYDGNQYMVYHRHDNPMTPNGLSRQICIDLQEFDGKRALKAIVPTHAGVGYLGPKTETAENLAFLKPVTATSYYHDTHRNHSYKPEYAVDDNNGTLWRPADNRMGHSLTIDLGTSESIRRVLTQFEHSTSYYQYLIELSEDGKTWTTFADRSENTRWGSPMVDRGDATGRFVRLTITGVDRPGIFAAVWNIKVFGTERKDPHEEIADRAFEQYVASTPTHAAKKPFREGFPAESETKPLVALHAADLTDGAPVSGWKNSGRLGGEFTSEDSVGVVSIANGRKAVRFEGTGHLTAGFPTPRTLAGNSSYTVSYWVMNPEIGDSECLLSWAGRGGHDAATAQFNYGSNPQYGAVGHWGFADMGFNGPPPAAGDWHHIAVTFDGVLERVYVNGELKNTAAKPLFMHEGRQMLVGASDPNTENFSGYLASLEVHDVPFDANRIKKIAANAPPAEVSIHLDSSRLPYGPLDSWNSQGSRKLAFTAVGSAPEVADVDGRLAARFESGSSLKADFEEPLAGNMISFVATLRAETPGQSTPLRIQKSDGTELAASIEVSDASWHQLVVSAKGIFLDGTPLPGATAPELSGPIAALTLGGPDFDGAISRFQTFDRQLDGAAASAMVATWKNEWSAPAAIFEVAPRALSPTVIVMAGQAPKISGGIQYRFEETSASGETVDSTWMDRPVWIRDRARPGASFTYRLKVRDRQGNVAVSAVSQVVHTKPETFDVFEPKFDVNMDLVKNGVGDSGWSNLVKTTEAGAITEMVATQDGALRLQSRSTSWDGSAAHGPLLYREVEGDFIATATVADYAGLSNRQLVGSNDGGLMLRKPRSEGPENLVALSFFLPWGQGNMVTNMQDGGRGQFSNKLGFDARKHLRMVRLGSKIHLHVSTDGETWEEMPNSPLTRADLVGQKLQMGVAHASYGEHSNFISFSDFSLSQPQ